VFKVTIPPHSKLNWDKHPSMNAGYMISGGILVMAGDGKERVVKAGEALIEAVIRGTMVATILMSLPRSFTPA